MKKYLIIMQQDPYANSLALEGLEFALALCAFNQQVSLLFQGPGIVQLLKQQDPKKIVAKDFTKVYAGLNLFGIDTIYVDQTSMQLYKPTDLVVLPQIMNEEQISNLINQHEIIIRI